MRHSNSIQKVCLSKNNVFLYRTCLYRNWHLCTEVDCTDILYVPKVIVPILTFNIPKLDVLKKHVPKVYVPKLSCTESDLPRIIQLNEMFCFQNIKWALIVCCISENANGQVNMFRQWYSSLLPGRWQAVLLHSTRCSCSRPRLCLLVQ